MTDTSMDSRTRAQRYADSRWWRDRWPYVASAGVKIVGYAIHRPEFDKGDSARFYSVEILHRDGTKTTRWVCVATDTVSDFVYECWDPKAVESC